MYLVKLNYTKFYTECETILREKYGVNSLNEFKILNEKRALFDGPYAYFMSFDLTRLYHDDMLNEASIRNILDVVEYGVQRHKK